VSGEGRGKGSNAVDAYRVWEVKANKELRLRLRSLYSDITLVVERAGEELDRKYGDAFRENPEKFGKELVEEVSRISGLPKGLLYYAGEWCRMVAVARGKSKKRSKFTPPPVPLLVKVVGNGERLHGNSSAVAVLDVSRNALRVPSAGVAVRLKPSLIRAVLEDIQRFEDIKLTLQLTAKGRLRLVAHRVAKQAWWDGDGRLAVIAVDVNSNHGLYLMAFTFDSEAKLVVQRVFKPPNTTLLRLLAAVMRSYSKVKSWDEAVQRFKQRRDVQKLRRTGKGYATEGALRLAERLREKINMTPERAERIARQASRKVKKVNVAWIRSVLREVRSLIRRLRDQGYFVVVVADVPRAESLRGSELQRTLLRVAERLENLVAYEGAKWFQPESSISGKRCPLCGKEGVEVQRRYYKCTRCDLVWGRDWAAAFNAAKLLLGKILKAEKHLQELQSWLRSHQRALAKRYYATAPEKGQRAPAPVPPAPPRGTPGVPRAAR